MTPVFLTINAELSWRHHEAGLPLGEIVARSLEPAGVGIGWQLAMLAAHGLRACFFVDPMPALAYGLEPFKRVVDAVLTAGQEVQLQCHPGWTAARPGDRGEARARAALSEYRRDEQAMLIAGARDLLVAAGAPTPIAFRAGDFAADDETLAALAGIGIAYDSSVDPARPSDVASPGRGLSPWQVGEVIECPVSVVEGGNGARRPFRIGALSRAEAAAALDHAAAEGHPAVVLVGHSVAQANRRGTRANPIHVHRFESVCAHLAARAGQLPTMHFADRPVLRLGETAGPLRADGPRGVRRRAEQLWSSWVAERAA